MGRNGTGRPHECQAHAARNFSEHDLQSAGEASCIVCAVSHGGIVVTDDNAARKQAKECGALAL